MSEKELNNQLIENESTETDEVVSDLTESSKRPNGLKGILSKKKTIIVCVCLIAFLAILYSSYIKPNIIVPMQTYNSAMELYNNGEFTRAREIFESLGDYKDSAVQAENCEIARADKMLEEGDYKPALDIYIQYPNNPNASEEKIEKCKNGIYDSALKIFNDKEYGRALTVFGYIEDYKDSKDYIEKCNAEIEKKKKEIEKAEKEAEAKKAAEEAAKEERLGEVTSSMEDYVQSSKYATNEMFTGLTAEMEDGENEDGEHIFVIKTNLEDSVYDYLSLAEKGSKVAITYEMILLDMCSFCRDIRDKFSNEGYNVEVFFYVWPPGQGKGMRSFSYVTNEGIQNNPFK